MGQQCRTECELRFFPCSGLATFINTVVLKRYVGDNFVRVMFRETASLFLMLAALVVVATAFAPCAAAQQDEALMPEQSAAKSKAILQQVINALGGPAYLNVRDSDCSGRLAQFGHSGELMGFAPFRDLWILQDKHRTEYISKGQNSIFGFLLGVDGFGFTHGGVGIVVFDGDHGWVLDKAGVSDEPDDAIKSFTEQLKSGMNNVLRSRLNESGVELRYAGTDLVDLKEVEWIEISDRDQRAFRLAVDKSTRLPLRWVVTVRDPETREHSENITSYGQFIPLDGVQTPLRVSRMENGREVSQIALESCKYNSNLSPELFTRASLEQAAKKTEKENSKGKKDNK